ncbi:hypothetical protein D9757_012877 [Collybiopsis confluens]|uniref:Uncharacterized protein n=1 Tax=Collybiopsis confluens TaxID=2823264 RepID=A0A8H5FW93_9AGAR|nr:hypothetical protein D9757_012877 [Collybiopsis confluens]
MTSPPSVFSRKRTARAILPSPYTISYLMASSIINYPKALGWSSVAASAIFAALYSPLVAYFVFQIVRARRLVVFTMTVFCLSGLLTFLLQHFGANFADVLVRMAAFIMRAIALGVESAGENLGLFIAIEVLFQAGFFGLLYSTYTLVLDRIELYEAYSLSIPIFGRTLGLLKNRRLFRFALMVPVALGIAAVDIASTDPTNTTASALRKTSAILFLILTAFQVVLSLVLISAERQGKDILPYNSSSFGARHVSFIIGLIAVLLLIREIFSVATIPDFARANNEHYWYPLVALPELLCAALYTVPGVIPPKIRQTATELDSV